MHSGIRGMLTRATVFDTPEKIRHNSIVFVYMGLENMHKGYRCSVSDYASLIVIGSHAGNPGPNGEMNGYMGFVQFTGIGIEGSDNDKILYNDNGSIGQSSNFKFNGNGLVTIRGSLDLGWAASKGSVIIGPNAGGQGSTTKCVSIGYRAGRGAQEEGGISIGSEAQGSGSSSQGNNAIAIGHKAAYYTQGNGAISLGGLTSPQQPVNAIAIGFMAGGYWQSEYSGAPGDGGGIDEGKRQYSSSIIINATGEELADVENKNNPSGVDNTAAGLFLFSTSANSSPVAFIIIELEYCLFPSSIPPPSPGAPEYSLCQYPPAIKPIAIAFTGCCGDVNPPKLIAPFPCV
jgi:hypothetical protein